MNNKFDSPIMNSAGAMTRRGALNRLGLGFAGLALARFGLNNAQAIAGGVLDGDAHPNVGGVVWLVSVWPDAQPPVVCGSGSLIHPRVYLTAGHGTYLIEGLIAQGALALNDLRVSFASGALNSATWRSVSSVLTHPDFAPNATSSADLGVLILSEPATGMRTVPVPPAGFLDALGAAGELKSGPDGVLLRVVGYGVDQGDANNGHAPFPPDGLRRSAQSEFQNLHDHWVYTDQNDSHDNGGSCECDSGGPLFHVNPVGGQETLVAVVSRGTLTNGHNYRVDTPVALDFINAVISRVSNREL